jgi:hypothetical protein
MEVDDSTNISGSGGYGTTTNNQTRMNKIMVHPVRSEQSKHREKGESIYFSFCLFVLFVLVV